MDQQRGSYKLFVVLLSVQSEFYNSIRSPAVKEKNHSPLTSDITEASFGSEALLPSEIGSLCCPALAFPC